MEAIEIPGKPYLEIDGDNAFLTIDLIDVRFGTECFRTRLPHCVWALDRNSEDARSITTEELNRFRNLVVSLGKKSDVFSERLRTFPKLASFMGVDG